MEKIIKTMLLLAGIVMLITGCERLQPPETPIPLSPDEIMIKEASPVVFFWQTVDEADYYALQIATDEEFENTVYINPTITDTSLVVDAETFEKLTMYNWQVAASNRAGSSEWSKTNRFFYGTQDWLISPADSVIFDTDAPTLLWHSYPQATNYVVRICRNSFSTYNAIWEDTVSDTAYQLPYEFLLENHPSSYHWSVLFLGTSEDLFWAPSRCFFSRIMPDLDTTYFPFGLGYEWCYEYHHWNTWGDPDYHPEKWDTVFVRVIDSTWINDTLVLKTEGRFIDLDDGYIVMDSIEINIGSWHLKQFISVTNPKDTAWEKPGGYLRVSHSDSVLEIYSFQDAGTGDPAHGLWYGTNRLIGIGPVYQYSGSYITGVDTRNNYRLLYFYNGTDTVYKADDWGEVLEVDLDTTYFPLGQDYQWTYQRHRWGWEDDSTITWDEYDTFTVTVSDSFWDEGIMKFQFSYTDKPFYDLGNPAKVLNGKVVLEVEGIGAVTPCVNPYLPERYWFDSPPFIHYSGDTLKIDCCITGFENLEEWTKRIRGLGTVVQYTNTGVWSRDKSFTVDSLILFTTPEGRFGRRRLM